MRIEALRKCIVARWPFNEARYPRIALLQGEERMLYMAKHIQEHLSHECGQLARVLELVDHAKDLERALDERHVNTQFVPIIRDLLVGTLRLADALGVSQERLDDALDSYLEGTVIPVRQKPGPS